MQTFLPYSDFKKSLSCLDYRRLGKQRVEAKQILNVFSNKTKGWSNHPATKMWEGYVDALKVYHNIFIEEWVGRGYKNNMELLEVSDSFDYPWWFGIEKFHRAQRARLIEKDKDFYLQKFPKEDEGFNNSKYFWPINTNQSFVII